MVREVVSGERVEGHGAEKSIAGHSGAGLTLELLDVLSAQHNYQLPYLPLSFSTPCDEGEPMGIVNSRAFGFCQHRRRSFVGSVNYSPFIHQLLSDAAFNSHFGFCCRQHILFTNPSNIYNIIR